MLINYYVSFLTGFTQISYFQFSNSKLKFNCILIVHISLANLITLASMLTRC
jgi:hypothetical protein